MLILPKETNVLHIISIQHILFPHPTMYDSRKHYRTFLNNRSTMIISVENKRFGFSTTVRYCSFFRSHGNMNEKKNNPSWHGVKKVNLQSTAQPTSHLAARRPSITDVVDVRVREVQSVSEECSQHFVVLSGVYSVTRCKPKCSWEILLSSNKRKYNSVRSQTDKTIFTKFKQNYFRLEADFWCSKSCKLVCHTGLFLLVSSFFFHYKRSKKGRKDEKKPIKCFFSCYWFYHAENLSLTSVFQWIAN